MEQSNDTAEVVCWRRKPERSIEDQFAAKYVPGDLSGVLAVARMCDPDAEAAEVTFTDGPVLIVRYAQYTDGHGYNIEFVEVRAGDWLAYSESGEFLYDSDDANWAQFYERASS